MSDNNNEPQYKRPIRWQKKIEKQKLNALEHPINSESSFLSSPVSIQSSQELRSEDCSSDIFYTSQSNEESLVAAFDTIYIDPNIGKHRKSNASIKRKRELSETEIEQIIKREKEKFLLKRSIVYGIQSKVDNEHLCTISECQRYGHIQVLRDDDSLGGPLVGCYKSGLVHLCNDKEFCRSTFWNESCAKICIMSGRILYYKTETKLIGKPDSGYYDDENLYIQEQDDDENNLELNEMDSFNFDNYNQNSDSRYYCHGYNELDYNIELSRKGKDYKSDILAKHNLQLMSKLKNYYQNVYTNNKTQKRYTTNLSFDVDRDIYSRKKLKTKEIEIFEKEISTRPVLLSIPEDIVTKEKNEFRSIFTRVIFNKKERVYVNDKIINELHEKAKQSVIKYYSKQKRSHKKPLIHTADNIYNFHMNQKELLAIINEDLSIVEYYYTIVAIIRRYICNFIPGKNPLDLMKSSRWLYKHILAILYLLKEGYSVQNIETKEEIVIFEKDSFLENALPNTKHFRDINEAYITNCGEISVNINTRKVKRRGSKNLYISYRTDPNSVNTKRTENSKNFSNSKLNVYSEYPELAKRDVTDGCNYITKVISNIIKWNRIDVIYSMIEKLNYTIKNEKRKEV